MVSRYIHTPALASDQCYVTLLRGKRAETRSTTQEQPKLAPRSFSFSLELLTGCSRAPGQGADTQDALLRALDPQS